MRLDTKKIFFSLLAFLLILSNSTAFADEKIKTQRIIEQDSEETIPPSGTVAATGSAVSDNTTPTTTAGTTPVLQERKETV